MTKKTILIAVVLLAFLLNWSAAEKPNIILILTDDQGYADLGCYGATDFKTPNVDRMAREGVRFTDFYVSPMCSPTRASLLTGCYSRRVNVREPINDPQLGMNPNEITIAEILKKEGYATAMVGKWHLGLSNAMLPVAQGFDYYAGLPLCHLRAGPRPWKDVDGGIYRRQWKTMGKEIKTTVEYEPNEPFFTQRITQEAIALIKKYRQQPFFLYISHAQVHHQVLASEKFQGRTNYGVYGDAIEELDWSTGEVFKTLKELELDEKTLVIYLSDNGPAPSGKVPGGSAKPLRGIKSSNWEGGVRVPCVMRWPGEIPPGVVCSEVAGAIDILPTIAQIAGAQMPSERVIDGRSILPLMLGEENAKSPHEAYYHFEIKTGTIAAVRSGPWKLLRTKRQKVWQLFNLEDDLGETTNVSRDNPEVVKRLQKLINEKELELQKNSRPLGNVRKINTRRPKTNATGQTG